MMGHREGTEAVVISSLLVESAPKTLGHVTRELARIEGVEVHGTHGAHIVISIEAPSISASYAIAASLKTIEGVTAVQLVYANFEDDPLIQEKLRA
jgi:nitrate reductase NapD